MNCIGKAVDIQVFVKGNWTNEIICKYVLHNTQISQIGTKLDGKSHRILEAIPKKRGNFAASERQKPSLANEKILPIPCLLRSLFSALLLSKQVKKQQTDRADRIPVGAK